MVRRLGIVLVAACAIGCGDDGGAPAVDAAVDASALDANVPVADAARPDGGVVTTELVWDACEPGSRWECATLVVPADYADPSGPTMSLALTRWPALSPTARIGTLVYGPGAGGSGVREAQRLVGELTPAAGEVVRRFDVIGMDIRGTGDSRPRIDCVDDATRRELYAAMDEAVDEDAVDDMIADAIEGCRDSVGLGTLSPFGMTSVARDVDRLRELLGEESISLFGVSYGTWFAAVYAVSFPERVRAAVLASSMPASNDAFERIVWQIRGGEIALTGFFDWCDATEDCAFRPPEGTTRDAFDAVAAAIAADGFGGALTLGPFRETVFSALYDDRYADLAFALDAAENGDPTPLLFAASASEPGEGIEWHLVHRALDETVVPTATRASWSERLVELRAEAPSFGALGHERNVFVRAALLWTDAPLDTFAVTAIPEAPPFMFLAGVRDPVTPVDGALTLRDALGNDSVLVQEQKLGHFVHRDPCGVRYAGDYLIAPSSVEGAPDVACPVIDPDETVVGTVAEQLNLSLPDNRRVETAIGNLTADAMREATGADIAVLNGGGLRASLPAAEVLPADTALRRPDPGYAAGPPYDVVVDDLRAVFPFGNRVVVETVTGADLHALFAWALDGWDPTRVSGNFVQVSGVVVTYDLAAGAIASLALTDGTPIANDATVSYQLAMPDYFWYGGAGYYAFAQRAAAAPVLGDSFEDVVAAYLTAHGDVAPVVDGRIVALTP